MPDATAHPTHGLAPVSPETLPDMNSSGNSPSPVSSPIHQPGPRSSTPLDFFGSIKNLVETTLLPSDLEEFGNEAVDFLPADDDGSCCSTPRGYASWGVLDELNKEADALRNRVRELERAHEDHQQQQQGEVSQELMDAAAEIGRNPVSTRISLSMETSRLTRDGTAETVSRDQILRRERGQLPEEAKRAPTSPGSERSGTEDLAAKAGASLIQLSEHLRAFQESALQERQALRDARDELAETRDRFETFRREAEVNASRQKAESAAALASRADAMDQAVEQARYELAEVFRLQNLDEAEALRRSKEELSKERGHAASWKKDAEEALKWLDQEKKAREQAKLNLAKAHEALAMTKGALFSERERCVKLMREKEAGHEMLNESHAARECTEADLAKAREEIKESGVALGRLQEELDTARRLASTLKDELERARISKASADVDDVAAVESYRKAEIERESRAEELRTSREALVAERERYAALMMEADKSRTQNELAEAAKSCAEIEVAEIRDDLRKSRETLAAERERYEALSQKADASDKHLETAHRAQQELRESREALAAERERFESLNQKANESEEHLKAARTAQEELQKFREALAAECERSALIMKEVDTKRAQNELAEAAKSRAEIEVAEVRDDLRKSRETLAAERERYETLSQKADASDKHRETAHRAQQELRESREALAAERERFESLKQKANESEEHLKAARTAQEELQKFREALAAECERSALIMKEVDTTRAQNELAEAAKGCAVAELVKSRDDLKETHKALAAEREKYVLLEREVEVTRGQQEDAQAAEGRAESELCKIRDDLVLTRRALAAEREGSATLNEKAQESDKHIEEARAAQEELRKSREALATERELSTAAKLQAEDDVKLRDELRVCQEALDAERERSNASVKNFEAAREALAKEYEKAEAARTQQEDAQAAKVCAEADLAQVRADLLESVRILDAERSRSETLSRRADESEEGLKEARAKLECSEDALAKVQKELIVLRGVRAELKRDEESLAAERKRFADYKKTAETKLKLLRREATKVGELEDELARKTLRLKQKDAETRALAPDRNVVRDLRECLSSKDNALNDLRQELGSLRQVSAAAALKQWSPRLQQKHQDHRALARAANSTSAANPLQPIISPTLDMARTFSLSSLDSTGEACSGLNAIVEEADAENRESSSVGEVGDVGTGIPVVPSPTGSESADESADDGGARGAVTSERPASPLRLKLDSVHLEDSDDQDDDCIFVGKFSAADDEASSGRRSSVVDSLDATRASDFSLSLSPTRRCRVKERASVSSGSRSFSPPPSRPRPVRASWCIGGLGQSHLKMPTPNCLSSTLTSARKNVPLDHGLGKEGNTVILELGAWRVRAGVMATAGAETEGRDAKSFSDEFPCCVARPTREDADLDELVNGASSLAAPMYAKFRETGVFVGGDAWYCCLDHPSIALRSKLRLSCPMQRGKKLSRGDADMLMNHAFGLLNQDSSCTPTLLTYKSTATAEEVLEMASVLLEAHRVPSIRMVNEAQVAALAVGLSTGVLVDIGESGFSVTPIFDGCPIAPGARWEACGGADVTVFMDTMLHSRANEQFNQMLDRRRLEMSREVKEELGYVPLDFKVEVEEHGSFRQRVMRICRTAQISPKLSQYEAYDSEAFLQEKQDDARITTTKSFTLKSGDELVVALGKERFHAPEILFTPRLWNDSVASKGLPEVVMDALSSTDADTKAEMLGDVVVVGGSAAFEGLGDRLEEELKAMLPEALANRVEVRVPSADDLQHRNPLSRCSRSAVMIGAELLLEKEGLDGEPWVTCTSWAEQPEVLMAALAPYVRDDSPRGKSVR